MKQIIKVILFDDYHNTQGGYLVDGVFDSSKTLAPQDGLFVAVKDVNFSALGDAYFGMFDGSPVALAQIEHAFKSNAAGWRASENGADLTPNFATIATGTDYDIVAVYDADLKAHYFLRSATNDFRRIWRSLFATGAASVYGESFNSTATFVNSTERFGLLDTGLLTPNIAQASPVVGALPNLPSADFVMQFTLTTVPSAGNIFIAVRQQDSNNSWRLTLTSGTAIQLRERVGGGDTIRANTAGGVLANGQIITLTAYGNTMTVWYDNTQAFSYTSAINFAAEVGFEYVSSGTGGVINNLNVWTAYAPAALATQLAAVTA